MVRLRGMVTWTMVTEGTRGSITGLGGVQLPGPVLTIEPVVPSLSSPTLQLPIRKSERMKVWSVGTENQLSTKVMHARNPSPTITRSRRRTAVLLDPQ